MRDLAIVIPAYKKTFLSKTLKSIAEQTCKNFTLYIGDDDSPYDLKKIVEQYEGYIDIVYKKFEENIGSTDLVAQWERCIKMTKEPFIWLFSDDDIMESECVEQYLSLPDEIRKSYVVHLDTKVLNSDTNLLTVSNSFPKIQNAKEYLDNKLSGRINYSVAVEFVFSRELYIECGGFVRYDLAWGSDFMTWLKFAENSKGIYSINRVGSYVIWRKSEENITPDYSSQIIKRKMFAWVENARDIKLYLIRNNYRPKFWYAKFVFGVMRRRVDNLSVSDMMHFTRMFIEEVGFPVESFLSFVYVATKRILYRIGVVTVKHN